MEIRRPSSPPILLPFLVPLKPAQQPAALGRRGKPLGPPALGPFIWYPSNASSSLWSAVHSGGFSAFILAEGEPALSRSQIDQTSMNCKDPRTREHCPCPGAWVYFTELLEQDVRFIIPLSPSQDCINHLSPHSASAHSSLCFCRSRTQRHGCWGVDSQPSLHSVSGTPHSIGSLVLCYWELGAGSSRAQIRPLCLSFFL